MNLAEMLRGNPLAQQRLADNFAMNKQGDLARMMQQHGTVQDPARVQEQSVLGNLPIDVPQPTQADMLMGADQVMNLMPQAGIFAGVGSKTANLLKMKQAEELAKQGVDRKQIWDETGWYNDVDGKWKYEIDDSGAKLNKDSFVESTYSINPNTNFDYRGSLGDALKHDELYKAYPESKNIDARLGFDEGPSTKFHTRPDGSIPASAGGSFSPTFNRIVTKSGYGEPSTRSTTLHELQHSIQEGADGFASGGNVSPELQQAYWNKYATDYRAGNGPQLRKDSNMLSSQISDLNRFNNINDYRNITKPRQLFNSMDFYKHSNTLRNALGPTPKRGPKYKKWAQDAGNMLADIMEKEGGDGFRYSVHSRAEVKRRLRNAKAKADRLDKKGAWKMAQLRHKMDDADPTMHQWDTEKLYDAYRKLAGEAEARNVQTRMDFTPQQRQAQPPWETLDVPENELLVRMLTGQ
tara:strand:- start:554 stop:1948 length:1395 start_codon:yes stop_codon:yes gene_type:complete